MLAEFEATSSWRYMVHYLELLDKVTPADVQRVARTYFKRDNRTVGRFVPGAAEEVDVLPRARRRGGDVEDDRAETQ